MCDIGLACVKIGYDDQKMIVCQPGDYNKKVVRDVIRRAFPELNRGILKKLRIVQIPIEVTSCYKAYHGGFDGQISRLKKENNWKVNPFVALRLLEEGGKLYCEAWAA